MTSWLMDELVMCKSPEDVHFATVQRILIIWKFNPSANTSVFYVVMFSMDSAQVEELHELNLALGDELGIPVVATGDVRYLDQEDYLYPEHCTFRSEQEPLSRR